jgi:ISXO2-like transposase domain/Transposase zinc-ribbon domain
MLPDDLPQDLPTFIARFGTDEACRDYLFHQRWPDGFRCRACGHGEAWALARRNIYECAACGRQHSLLKDTIFEQTKTGLARWFLAIYLVTSSKGGIAAAELQRQMGFGSYQTAWSWLHKIRKAMVRRDRQPLHDRVEADETYVGGAKPGRSGRGAAGKTLVAGAVESGRGKARGRRLGRLRLACLPDAGATSLEGFLAANVAKPAAVVTDGWAGYADLPAQGYHHEPINLSTSWVMLRCACRPSIWSSASQSAGFSAPITALSARSISRPISTSTSSASTAAPPGASATASRG